MRESRPIVALIVLSLAFGGIVGCGERAPEASHPGFAVVTNTIERTVWVTNTVERVLTLTNVVEVMREKPRALTPRKTAVYAVRAAGLRGSDLRTLLLAAGARIVNCEAGAVATIEAPDAVISAIRAGGVMSVGELLAVDKCVPQLAGAVRIYPLSTMDMRAVQAAVSKLGGEPTVDTASVRPCVKAKLSAEMILELAGRVDVLRIERDDP